MGYERTVDQEHPNYEFWNSKLIMARVEHTCTLCKAKIEPDTLYERTTYKEPGNKIKVHKLCERHIKELEI